MERRALRPAVAILAALWMLPAEREHVSGGHDTEFAEHRAGANAQHWRARRPPVESVRPRRS